MAKGDQPSLLDRILGRRGSGEDSSDGTDTEDTGDGTTTGADTSTGTETGADDADQQAIDDTDTGVQTGSGDQQADDAGDVIADDGSQQAIDDTDTGVQTGSGDEQADDAGDVIADDGSQQAIDDTDTGVQTGSGDEQADDAGDVIADDGSQQAIDDTVGVESDVGDGEPQGGSAPFSGASVAGMKEVDLSLGDGPPTLDPDDARELAAMRQPQLDPDVVQARLGLGPTPPLPDDAPDDLAFGSGARLDARDLEPGQGVADLDASFEPASRVVPADLRLDGSQVDELADDGLDIPAAGVDPAAHEVLVDDTTDHSDPTDVPIE